MAELNVRFDLSFGTRSLRCIMAACMIFSVATEVASESVTLTTYYPAPSGVYTQMITTGNTYLDRDSLGKVGIQTAVPSSVFSVNGGMSVGGAGYATGGPAAPSGAIYAAGPVGIGTNIPTYTLDVNGNIRVQGAGLYNKNGFQMMEGNAADWLRINQANSWASGTAAYGSWAFGTGGVTIGNWTANAPSGTLAVTGDSTFGGTITDMNGFLVLGQAGGCTEVNYLIDGPVQYCPAGMYATATSGVIADLTLMPFYTIVAVGGTAGGQAPMYCCNCPSGVCPNLP